MLYALFHAGKCTRRIPAEPQYIAAYIRFGNNPPRTLVGLTDSTSLQTDGRRCIFGRIHDAERVVTAPTVRVERTTARLVDTFGALATAEANVRYQSVGALRLCFLPRSQAVPLWVAGRTVERLSVRSDHSDSAHQKRPRAESYDA